MDGGKWETLIMHVIIGLYPSSALVNTAPGAATKDSVVGVPASGFFLMGATGSVCAIGTKHLLWFRFLLYNFCRSSTYN